MRDPRDLREMRDPRDPRDLREDDFDLMPSERGMMYERGPPREPMGHRREPMGPMGHRQHPPAHDDDYHSPHRPPTRTALNV